MLTEREYRIFQYAYRFFNATLFANSLPDLLVTLQRMNPDGFTGRSDELILSTLAREMVHVWQDTHGTPRRRGYHDRQWMLRAVS